MRGVAVPLITVKLRPGFSLDKFNGRQWPGRSTYNFLCKAFGPKLPGLFVLKSEAFGLDPDTPEDGVLVEFEYYGVDTINPSDIWIVVRFSEEEPSGPERIRIRNEVYRAIVDLFQELGVASMGNLMIEFFWGPTNGRGMVNGTPIEW